MICEDKIKVLVVDDTVVYREIVSDILDEMPEVEVLGTANNGKIAISRMSRLQPDLLILDVEMPETDGIGVLKHIRDHSLDMGAIMLSSFTQDGSQRTIEALSMGAFDFIPKPETTSMDQSRKVICESLKGAVQSFIRQVDNKRSLLDTVSCPAHPEPLQHLIFNSPAEIIALGISTGGPNALHEVLPQLPPDLDAAIFIVQHMPPMFTKSLADSLNRKSHLTIVEASDGQVIEPNWVYIAPGGQQMKVASGPGGKKVIKITDDPPEKSCKPSVDYLFRSIAQHYGSKAVSVIMTGMGNDGKLGMKLMKRAGSLTIAQDQNSCVVYGMPKEVIEAGIVDIVSPLGSISDEICKAVLKHKVAHI